MAALREYMPEDFRPLLKAAGVSRIALSALVLGATAATVAALLGQPVDIVVFSFLILALVPAASAYGIIASYDGDVNARAPELFYDLSEHVRAGGSFTRALRRVSGSSYGAMSDEVYRLLSETEDEGFDTARALKAMARRVNNSYVTRSVAVIGEALRSSSDVEGILKMVAAEGRLALALARERRSGILPAVAVVYLTTVILLAVVALCITSLVPMSQQLQGLASGEAGPAESPREFALPYYFLSLSVALCSGLIVGVMRDSTAFGGLKDAALLVTLAFIVFEAVVFPGFDVMGVLGQ